MSGVYFVSLGCPKNLVDTEVLAGILLNSGRNITFDAKEADVYLINTCAFLPSAREEAFEEIRKAVNWITHSEVIGSYNAILSENTFIVQFFVELIYKLLR